MSELQIAPFSEESLKVEPSWVEPTMTVNLIGSATLYEPESLRVYLQDLHAENIRLEAKEVVVDLRQLEFMNSAGFSTFIDWLVALQEEPAEKQYKVRYRSNSEYPWQRRSLHALQCLAVDLVTVES